MLYLYIIILRCNCCTYILCNTQLLLLWRLPLLRWLGFSQLTIDMQTPATPRSAQKWSYVHEIWPMCWYELKINFPIFFSRYVWSFLRFSVTNLNFHVCHRLKKILQKWLKFTWKMRNVLKRMKNQFSNFSYFHFFDLWLIMFTIFGHTI